MVGSRSVRGTGQSVTGPAQTGHAVTGPATTGHAVTGHAVTGQAVTGHAPPPGAVRVAAIDCGTNSLRLLIADVDTVGGQLTDVDRRMEIVRLGQGVDATGMLAPEALTRTFRVLADYARAIADSGVSAVRMVATSATRDASNASDFVQGVTRLLGIAPEVVSGDEEAQLSYSGATTELRRPDQRPGGPERAGTPKRTGGAERGDRPDRGDGPQPPYLVVDIGGGSTEFVLGESQAVSVDIGCVRLTERHLHGDPPDAAQIEAATRDIDAALSEVAARIPVTSARTLVGLAGSVTTVTGIALSLPAYDAARIHHARISAARVHEVTLSLLGKTREQRSAIGVMHPGRVDVIGAGALVLDRIMICLGFGEVMASEHDILDGIAWSIAAGAR